MSLGKRPKKPVLWSTSTFWNIVTLFGFPIVGYAYIYLTYYSIKDDLFLRYPLYLLVYIMSLVHSFIMSIRIYVDLKKNNKIFGKMPYVLKHYVEAPGYEDIWKVIPEATSSLGYEFRIISRETKKPFLGDEYLKSVVYEAVIDGHTIRVRVKYIGGRKTEYNGSSNIYIGPYTEETKETVWKIAEAIDEKRREFIREMKRKRKMRWRRKIGGE